MTQHLAYTGVALYWVSNRSVGVCGNAKMFPWYLLVDRSLSLLYNELRRDYFVDRWVVIASERARRPMDLAKNNVRSQTQNHAVCPMCPGNEHMTPPAVLVYLPSPDGSLIKTKDKDDLRHKNWLIRCVPNLYPAFSPPKNADEAGADVLRSDNFGYAVGHHEVLIESPDHNAHPPDVTPQQLVHIINAYKDRLSALSQKPYVGYVQIFRNHGIAAGASQPHPHSQIITTSFTPPKICQEIAAAKGYWETHKECLMCSIVRNESQTPRSITSSEYFEVIAPYASVHPMEYWIIPKRHSLNILDLTPAETADFAQTLKASLKALKDLINDPPYNFSFHITLNKDASDYYHWSLQVYPALTTWAGFEKSTGIYINTIKPEIAAAELRKMLTR